MVMKLGGFTALARRKWNEDVNGRREDVIISSSHHLRSAILDFMIYIKSQKTTRNGSQIVKT